MLKFMPDLSDNARIQIMQQNASKIEETTYLKALTPDELDIKRESLTDNAIALNDFQEEMRKAMSGFKSKMKPLADANKELLRQIKTRQEEIEGTLYYMADYDNGIMECYNDQGEFISSRRLRPDEKQGNLYAIKSGTNN